MPIIKAAVRRFLLLLPLLIGCDGQNTAAFSNFVTAQGDRLMDGRQELRFISFNIPNLHYIEDNLPFAETNPWRLPNEFEIRDALVAVRQMGGQVARIYTLSVKSAEDGDDIPRHVVAPGVFNEEAFAVLDKVLQIANQEGVRLIIPFVDNWQWWGGVGEYAAFRGKPKEAFWSDPVIIADFKATIAFVLNRVNTLTGVRYADDKAVLAWETGNELTCPPEWTAEIAAFVKSIDKNHLVMDGFHSSRLRASFFTDANIDLVTTHHYEKNTDAMIDNIKKNIEQARGKKPYIVGEFGFIDTPGVKRVLNTVIEGPCSGALIWSLRFHNRDGGFYRHSEPYGGNRFKAYHWPGFPSGDAYDERGCLELMRQKAYAVRKLPVPALEPPQPPTLLPIPSVAAISWQGSTGASSYIVERSETEMGPWETVAEQVSDADVQYRPLFNDESVEIGDIYCYRVRAVNYAGISPPSNVVMAPKVLCKTSVDECADWTRLSDRSAGVFVKIDEARRAKEDSHRFRGSAGDAVTYRVNGPVQAVRLYTFFLDEIKPFLLHGSADGKAWRPLTADMQLIGDDEGDYRYIKPVLFSSAKITDNIKIVKIILPTTAELARTEIEYGQ